LQASLNLGEKFYITFKIQIISNLLFPAIYNIQTGIERARTQADVFSYNIVNNSADCVCHGCVKATDCVGLENGIKLIGDNLVALKAKVND
jgi:hypothetical protein